MDAISDNLSFIRIAKSRQERVEGSSNLEFPKHVHNKNHLELLLAIQSLSPSSKETSVLDLEVVLSSVEHSAIPCDLMKCRDVL